MKQTWIFVCIIINVMMIYCAYGQDLSVNIVPVSTKFTEKQDVIISLNYKNKGTKSVQIYKWFLPNQQLFHPLFKITRDGNPVEYIGPLVKRRAPTAEDMITIEPGKILSTLVQLSSVYNMTQTGNYIIQFISNIESMLSSSSRSLNIENTASNSLSNSVLQSPPVGLFAEGRSNFVSEEKAKLASQPRSTTYSFIGCSSSRQSLIISAIHSAASYSSNCVSYVSPLKSTTSSRYTTWFGTYSATNLVTLRTHFTNIYTVLNSKPMTFDCSTCTQPSTYAYVYQNLPYKIYLCGSFWNAPATGTDSKAGTLVHETSHFTVVAGTLDHAYGQTAAKNLAKTNPTKALNNADSHEYFAENTPSLT